MKVSKEMVTEKILIFNVGFNPELFLNSYYVVSSVNMNNFLEKNSSKSETYIRDFHLQK